MAAADIQRALVEGRPIVHQIAQAAVLDVEQIGARRPRKPAGILDRPRFQIGGRKQTSHAAPAVAAMPKNAGGPEWPDGTHRPRGGRDRKSTRMNSSHTCEQ